MTWPACKKTHIEQNFWNSKYLGLKTFYITLQYLSILEDNQKHLIIFKLLDNTWYYSRTLENTEAIFTILNITWQHFLSGSHSRTLLTGSGSWSVELVPRTRFDWEERPSVSKTIVWPAESIFWKPSQNSELRIQNHCRLTAGPPATRSCTRCWGTRRSCRTTS